MIGVILLSSVVAILLAWLVGAGLGLIAQSAPYLRAFSGSSAARELHQRPATALLASLVLVPTAVAFFASLAILLPSPFGGCHCAVHGGHHLHLCLNHPSLAEPLVLPALAIALLWGITTVWRLGAVISEVVRGEILASCLRKLPWELVDGVAVHLGDKLGVGAFTVGLAKPVIAVDRSLWEQLPPEERRAVVLHEQAHIVRRDALTLAVLGVASALTIGALPWVRAWKAASEIVCDRHAAQRLGDPNSVVSALLSVARFQTDHPWGGRLSASLGMAPGSHLEERARSLFALDKSLAARRLNNDLAASVWVLLGVAAFIFLLLADSFHHGVETLLGYVAP